MDHVIERAKLYLKDSTRKNKILLSEPFAFKAGWFFHMERMYEGRNFSR